MKMIYTLTFLVLLVVAAPRFAKAVSGDTNHIASENLETVAEHSSDGARVGTYCAPCGKYVMGGAITDGGAIHPVGEPVKTTKGTGKANSSK